MPPLAIAARLLTWDLNLFVVGLDELDLMYFLAFETPRVALELADLFPMFTSLKVNLNINLSRYYVVIIQAISASGLSPKFLSSRVCERTEKKKESIVSVEKCPN